MKKILSIFVLGIAFAANADYLYWLVDDKAISGKDIQGRDTSFDWSKAILKYEENETVATLNRSDAEFYESIYTYASADVGDANDWSAKTFFIELYDSNDKWLAQSGHFLGSTIAQYIFGGSTMSQLPTIAFGTIASGATYSVPEPTSGLLFLIGGMLLGLRRRREVV